MERREFSRINIACKISMALGDRLSEFSAHTENIGAGGMMIIMDAEKAPSVSTAVDLELFLWNMDQPIKCKGEIAWVNEISPQEIKPRIFNVGIRFTEISDTDRDAIGRFVDGIISTWHS
jgi:c-di-GMP-binding flagellar brake protein YcgR